MKRFNLKSFLFKTILVFTCISLMAANAKSENYLFFDTIRVNNTISIVTASKDSVLFADIDNPLTLIVNGKNTTALKVSVNNGVVRKTDSCYAVWPYNVGTAVVTIRTSKGKIVKQEFKVVALPDVQVAVAGLRGGNISRTALIDAGGISVGLPNSNISLGYEVISFSMMCIQPGIDAEYVQRGSDRFTQSQINCIRRSRRGERLYIERIKVRGPDGKIVNMGEMVFKIF